MYGKDSPHHHREENGWPRQASRRRLAKEIRSCPTHCPLTVTPTPSLIPRPQHLAIGLSSDRANAVRRVMQSNGIHSGQVTRVRGFATQRLCKPEAPLDRTNRRIPVIVQYVVKNDDDDEKSPSTSSEKSAETKQSPPVGKPAARP